MSLILRLGVTALEATAAPMFSLPPLSPAAGPPDSSPSPQEEVQSRRFLQGGRHPDWWAL